MHGRAQIINSLLLSKLIYIASMFSVPEEVIKEANRIIFKFFMERTGQGSQESYDQ